MKKLRLIKPWNLSAIRQRLADERCAPMEDLRMPCFAGPEGNGNGQPGGESELWERSEETEPENLLENQNQAPFSDVIFAYTNNIRN
jgi:hypothetical protein